MDYLIFSAIFILLSFIGGMLVSKWADRKDRQNAYKKTKRHIPALGQESLARILR